MKIFSQFRKSPLTIISFALAVILILPGCKTKDLKEEILGLADSQSSLIAERDSLQNLLASTTHQLDTTSAGYHDLKKDLELLGDKNKSLTSGYNARGRELKKATTANNEISKIIDQQEIRNDSLQKEIAALENKIASVDRQMEETQAEKAKLEEAISKQEEKAVADSIADAEPRVYLPVGAVKKDKKYINITELGAGFGLGDVSVDFSKSLFSVTNISGYVIDKNFMTGIGTGVNIYNGGVMVPLYRDLRYTFKETKFTPFLVADGGVLLYLKDLKSTGLFINPAVGLNKNINDKMTLHLSTGLFIQDAPAGTRNSFVNFRLGLSYKPR